MKKILFLFAILLHLSSHAQLPDGSMAPDFTLTDYYGTSHNLYSYLDEGKTVFLEIFAAHCPSCWNYHQTHRMKNMYNLYGPDGTDEIMVLALEYDQWNDSTAFTGNHEPWVTQGDWLTGTPYPIFNVENPDREVFEDYQVTFYPVIYKICPDGITERVNTSTQVTELYEQVLACQTVLSLDDFINLDLVYIDQLTESLVIEEFQNVETINIWNLQGQRIESIDSVTQPNIRLSQLELGVYLVEIQTAKGALVKKIYWE